ncbi:MAG: methyltransferase domain-containing protein [Candidatus Moraniibacteriota bacterium]|nr:MAG: methyltransferase domain-containing protein [Candidatus Moranbacteria bacterium]
MGVALTNSFVKPEDVLGQLSLSLGASVADFGCGSGFFSLAFARAVGTSGTVYALDILPSSLEAVASRAKALGLSNLVVKRANLEREKGSGLPDNHLDWVLLKDVLFQNKSQETLLWEAYRVLKPGGSLFIMEWNDRELSLGPDPNIRISRERLVELLSERGFQNFTDIEAGDFHYALV